MTDIGGDGFPSGLLTSFGDVCMVLGGSRTICALTGNSKASLSNWRKAQRFPARHYRVIRDALALKGYRPDMRLFAFTFIELMPVDDTVAA